MWEPVHTHRFPHSVNYSVKYHPQKFQSTHPAWGATAKIAKLLTTFTELYNINTQKSTIFKNICHFEIPQATPKMRILSLRMSQGFYVCYRFAKANFIRYLIYKSANLFIEYYEFMPIICTTTRQPYP